MTTTTTDLVAVVRAGPGLGELCLAVPAIRAIRAGRPAHRLVLLVPDDLVALAEASNLADEVVSTPAEDPPPRHLAGCALAVDLAANARGCMRTLGADLVVSPHLGEAPGDWDDAHQADRLCALVGGALGIDADPESVALDVPPITIDLRSDRPAVVDDRFLVGLRSALLHVGAGAPARRWPTPRWAAVLRELRAHDVPVVLTGSVDDRQRVDAVVEMAGCEDDDGCALAVGRTDLVALARLVQQAAVVVSSDTGIAHLASVLRRPSVVLLGPTGPDHVGPPQLGPHTALWAGSTGDHEGDEVDPGLLRITAAEVLAAVEKRLALV